MWPAVAAILLLIGLSFLVALLANLVKIWSALRQRPANHELYATKHELDEVEERLTRQAETNRESSDKWRGEITGRFDSMQKTLITLSNDLMRWVGRTEGQQLTNHGN